MVSKEKMMALRSLCRSAAAAAAAAGSFQSSSRFASRNHLLPHRLLATRSFFGASTSSASSIESPSRRLHYGGQAPLALSIGNIRCFSEGLSHMPDIKDPNVLRAFKDLMAASWDELPVTTVHDAKEALSKNTDDKAGQEALANVFRAAEAVEEFGGILTSLKMEFDDSIGMSGEDVKPMSDEVARALRTVYERYINYLNAFGPDEVYLKKKVETELGSKMIFLKMRCAGLGHEWGKVSVLGTSGLSGSYVEQRA